MPLYARTDGPDGERQLLSEHLAYVAEIAGCFADDFGAGEWARAAGLMHDWGKASKKFQDKLDGASLRVDHSTEGAQMAEKTFKQSGKLIAACIAGHHGGLPDGKSEKDSCLASRLKRESIPKVMEQDELMLPNTIGKLPIKASPGRTERTRLAFQISFFVRMLFSCLVDADRLDAEHFTDPDKSSFRGGYPKLSGLESRFREKMNSVLEAAPPTLINRLRREILDCCSSKAVEKPGLFSLTVPTGGGKTLSSMAFALRHALCHGLKRVIYVIPYTSIIEQNAQVFRDFVGKDAVIEHHSSFDTKKLAGMDSEYDEEIRKFELAAENWDAPIIVTTSVQFFESLFASRTSKCRKLHNIAKSIIILDEAQMLPVEFLIPCLEAIRELAGNYGASVVLCTATQPALSKNEDFRKGLENVREIAPDPKGLYTAFRRVRTERAGLLTMDQLAEDLRGNEQVLCIVNTRREAREMFEKVQSAEGAYHLSALMCPEHRSEKLAEIKDRIKQKQSCRLVSTRLIEAGVDIDFPAVYRAVAGIDSIAQAAGRCNREDKLGRPGRVVLFEFEHGTRPGPFRRPAEVAGETIRKYPDDPLSLDAVDYFFRFLYWRAGDELDARRILDDLREGLTDCFFPFQNVAKKFRIIKEEGETILIPFNDKARGAIASLRVAEFPGRILRELQRFTVQVYPRELAVLEDAGAAERVQSTYAALTEQGFEQLYKEDVGLVLPKDGTNFGLLLI